MLAGDDDDVVHLSPTLEHHADGLSTDDNLTSISALLFSSFQQFIYNRFT